MREPYISPVREVVNLTFHGVGTPPPSIPEAETRYWVSQNMFHSILDLAALHQDVRLTFDDGNSSDVELALPALRARKLTAAFFVLAGRLDQRGSVSRQDLRTLRENGMIVGLHGMNHVPWREIDEGQLTVELVDSRKLIEDATGDRIDWAACPFGSYGRHVLRRLESERFERVFTSDRGPVRDDAWLQARNTIQAADDCDSVQQVINNRRVGLHRRIKLLLKRSR